MKLYWEIQYLGKKIVFRGCYVGPDLNVILTGGDSPHIGSVSIAAPGEDGVADVSDYVYPGHRDEVISSLFAGRLCSRLGCHVAVSCGIHYDHITRPQIDELVEKCRELLREIVE